MASLNKVMLVGNIGRDAEVRYTQSGDPILSFSIATSETWEGKSGKQEKTEWHKVDVFGGLAKALKSYLTKGKKVYVEGKLVYSEWTDKEGNKRQKATVVVSGFNSNIILLSAPGAAVREEPEPKKEESGEDGDVPF